MKAYNRNQRIQILHFTSNQDGSGDSVESWTEYGKFWASVEPLRGRELFLAQQVSKENPCRMVILYNSQTKVIDQKMRVSHNGKLYDVTSVIDIDCAHQYIELMLREVI